MNPPKQDSQLQQVAEYWKEQLAQKDATIARLTSELDESRREVLKIEDKLREGDNIGAANLVHELIKKIQPL